eukprot:jgi/Tetstr1/466223/TSEL_010781.t2
MSTTDTTPEPFSTPLKRLEFVRTYSSYGVERATALATAALSAAPPSLTDAANSAYASVAPRVEPYALSAYYVVAPRASSLLEHVDTRDLLIQESGVFEEEGGVDGVAVNAEKLYGMASQQANALVDKKNSIHKDGMERYAAAKELYLMKVEEILEVLRAQGIKGAALDAADLVAAKVAELRAVPASITKSIRNRAHDAFVQLHAAWDKLSSHPEVAKVLNLYTMTLNHLKAKATDAHDMVVSNPNYGAALDTAGTYLNKVQETTLYNKLYEALGPYAEPYASRLASSTYVTATVDYFKPAPSLEGINTK